MEGVIRMIATNPRQNATSARCQHFLTAETLLKYLLGTSERIDTMITCKKPSAVLMTTDNELYQAFGSLKNYDSVNRAKIAKLFEAVDVFSYKAHKKAEKKILTHQRVEELRTNTLKKQGVDKNE